MSRKKPWQSLRVQALLVLGTLVGLVLFLVLFWWAMRSLEGAFTKTEARAWIFSVLFFALSVGTVYFLNEQANQRSQVAQKAADADRAYHREQAAADRDYHRQQLEQHRQQLESDRLQRQADAAADRQERREQVAYQAYLQQMATLFIDNHIATEQVESEVFQFAQALTADVLRGLKDENRRNQVIFFLRSLTLTETETGERDRMSSLLRGINLDCAQLRNLQAPQANFSQAHLIRSDLRGAIFTGASLKQAHLEKSVLTGAYLERAYLYEAHLNSAYLEGAYLVRANLVQASLREAKLISANLEGAILDGAILDKADLTNANFRGASVDGVSWETALFRNTTMPDGRVRDGER